MEQRFQIAEFVRVGHSLVHLLRKGTSLTEAERKLVSETLETLETSFAEWVREFRQRRKTDKVPIGELTIEEGFHYPERRRQDGVGRSLPTEEKETPPTDDFVL
jgi:hypothetical protein